MSPEQLDKITAAIRDSVAQSIESNVNGKIRSLTQKVDDYIKEDNEWKYRANPILEMGANIQGFGKVGLYLLGIVATIAGLIFASKK